MAELILSADNLLNNKKAWQDKGYRVWNYDREAVKAATLKKPEWIHFGAGNIFRAFQAALLEELLDKGVETTGLIAAEGFDYEIIDKMYRPHDNIGALVTLKSNGSVEKTIVSFL